MIKVLIAEDSKTLQQLLVWTLSSEPDIKIVGLAHNGQEAIKMTRQFKPDVITMDVNMPELDGLEATRLIMSEQPTPIIIVTGNNGSGEILTAMTALQAGALALINKPSSLTKESFQESAKLLIRQIKAMAGMKLVKIRRKDSPQPVAVPLTLVHSVSYQQLSQLTHVAIAASTGGPAALANILKSLPAKFPLPIFVVQHMAQGFINGFVEWLGTQVNLKVQLAEQHQNALPGVIYLAPEDKHLGVNSKGQIELSCSAKLGGFRPSASYLFHSLAGPFGNTTLAIVLTGMGNDGLHGATVLQSNGALVVTQDEASCVVYGMPKAVADAGLSHCSLTPPEIAALLLKLHHLHAEKPQ